MRKYNIIAILLIVSSVAFSQRGNWRGGMGKGGQMDPSKAPKKNLGIMP